jgi:hypothetical protein
LIFFKISLANFSFCTYWFPNIHFYPKFTSCRLIPQSVCAQSSLLHATPNYLGISFKSSFPSWQQTPKSFLPLPHIPITSSHLIGVCIWPDGKSSEGLPKLRYHKPTLFMDLLHAFLIKCDKANR